METLYYDVLNQRFTYSFACCLVVYIIILCNMLFIFSVNKGNFIKQLMLQYDLKKLIFFKTK